MNVLLLGGCGFLGRHILSELVESETTSHVVIADKVPPQMAWLNSEHQKLFQNPKVTFRSANLINEVSCCAVFEELDFDWVINAASETKMGLDEAVYKEGIFKVSLNAMRAAAAKKVKVYVEISSGQMNSSEKIPVTEDNECKPWGMYAKFKNEVEKALTEMENLNWIVVRPAIMYGPGDKIGLTPRLLVGAISKYSGTEMKLLWDQSLKMNTVHVRDVARAVVWLCQRGKTREVYHLVDEGQSSQESITNIIADIFNVQYSYCGTVMSKIAVADAESTLQFVNEKHLEPWLKMCNTNGILNTPLSPYANQEILLNKHVHLDGSKLRKEGFQYCYPKLTQENLVKVLDDFIAMNLLPKNVYSNHKS